MLDFWPDPKAYLRLLPPYGQFGRLGGQDG